MYLSLLYNSDVAAACRRRGPSAPPFALDYLPLFGF